MFRMVDPDFVNFPVGPNTAHDLFILDFATGELDRITPEGGIQIIPDWAGDQIVYPDLIEDDDYQGMASIDDDGKHRRRFGLANGRAIEWIP